MHEKHKEHEENEEHQEPHAFNCGSGTQLLECRQCNGKVMQHSTMQRGVVVGDTSQMVCKSKGSGQKPMKDNDSHQDDKGRGKPHSQFKRNEAMNGGTRSKH